MDIDDAVLIVSPQYHGEVAAPDTRSESLDDDSRRDLAKLVLDGVLEIESDRGFVSGVDAVPRLFRSRARSLHDRTPEPSKKALEYAQALLPLPAEDLAGRLYRYGSLPASPRWFERVSTTRSVADQIGLHDLMRHPDFARNGWSADPVAPESRWFFCHRQTPTQPRSDDARIHKIYIGVSPTSIGDALHAIADPLLTSQALAFKVAATPRDLLRPDKCVVYFETPSAREEASAQFARILSAAPAHPVPFVEACPHGAPLWWNTDRSGADDQFHASSRYEVCALLALSMTLAAQADDASLSPIEFALLRLALDGWDTETFASPERYAV